MRLLHVLIATLLLISACSGPVIAEPKSRAELKPVEAWRHRGAFKSDLIARYGHARYLNLFAAQIMQESLWKPDAVSWVGAYGCGQFMPATQGDAKYWARDLGVIDWGNCEQNARASIRYMRAIYKRIPKAQGRDNWRYAEAIKDYNRGMGNGDKERRLGFCVRKDAACDETTTYLARILGKWQIYFNQMSYGSKMVEL